MKTLTENYKMEMMCFSAPVNKPVFIQVKGQGQDLDKNTSQHIYVMKYFLVYKHICILYVSEWFDYI